MLCISGHDHMLSVYLGAPVITLEALHASLVLSQLPHVHALCEFLTLYWHSGCKSESLVHEVRLRLSRHIGAD